MVVLYRVTQNIRYKTSIFVSVMLQYECHHVNLSCDTVFLKPCIEHPLFFYSMMLFFWVSLQFILLF